MAEDRSLDEFADADSTSADGDAADEDVADDDAADEDVADDDAADEDVADDTERSAAEPDPSPEDVEPAITTSAWDSDGTACERCGERIGRRWIDDGALVCADCKTW